MSSNSKSPLAKGLDLPFMTAAGITAAFYWFVHQDSMRDTLLHRYTTEHVVEYVVVGFFIWGLTDIFYRLLAYPREIAALRKDVIPARHAREPVANASMLKAHLAKQPQWVQESRYGQRINGALTYLEENGSADGFSDYLYWLADMDEAKTHDNFSLVRFIAWLAPVLGFLGTVLHFGTALTGLSVSDMADRLPEVVSELGAAFNCTTAALACAITMMFSMFICERAERGIVKQIDRKSEGYLLNRFEVADANVTPFLAAVRMTNDVTIASVKSALEAHMATLVSTFDAVQQRTDARHQRVAQLWEEALRGLQQQAASGENEREQRFRKILEEAKAGREAQRQQLEFTVAKLDGVKRDFERFVDTLAGVVQGEGKLMELQTSLSQNLQLLRETKQIDEAVHGLTAAIHLLTARSRETKAA